MNPKQRQSAQWQALPGCGHAERALQASWWQEHGAAHAGGPRAQQAGKLETWALFAGSQGGTVARAGGNTCGPPSARLDLKAPAVPRPVGIWSPCRIRGCERRRAPAPRSGYAPDCRRQSGAAERGFAESDGWLISISGPLPWGEYLTLE